MIDLSSEFGKHVQQRLAHESVIWLTTVSSDGTPQPNPVWFFWDGNSILIYSQPGSAKLKNIWRNPKVSLNLEGATELGGDVVVITGIATVEEHTTEPDPGYVAKYEEAMHTLGRNFTDVYREYNVPIRVELRKLRGF